MTNQEPKPWIVCPDCGCGMGEDHKRECPRRHRPGHPAREKQK